MNKSKVKLTLESLKDDFARVSKKLGTDYFTLRDYEQHASPGHTIWNMNRQLGIGFNDAKGFWGYPLAKTGYQQGISKNKTAKSVTPKVFCKRGEGSMINWNTGCFPGNDACLTCPHPNESNRMSHTLTKEEEDEFRFTGNTQGGCRVEHGRWSD